jgi:cyanamide hydratase
VGEAIVRHADIGETGNLTSVGQLIQLSTLFGELSFSPFLIFMNAPSSWHRHGPWAIFWRV